MGKTATIKQRAVYVYAPTEEMLAEWKKVAESYGMSLSSFLVEVIDDAMRKNPQGLGPKEELEARLVQATSEVNALRTEVETQRQLRKQVEEELAIYRQGVSAVPRQESDVDMLRRVVELFRNRMVWKVDEIPGALGLSPGNTEQINRLITALDQLRDVGMIEGDFEEVRCRLGRRKPKLSSKDRARIKQRARKRRPVVPARLRAKGDDRVYGHIVPVKPP